MSNKSLKILIVGYPSLRAIMLEFVRVMYEFLREKPGMGAPLAPVEKPIESLAQHQERRIDAYFDAREQQSQAIVRWIRKLEEMTVSEEMFSQKYYDGETDRSSDEEIFHDRLEPQIADYPPELQQKFRAAWYTWAGQERVARRQIKEIAGTQEGAGALDDRQLGDRFFKERVKGPSTGVVRFSQTGPLFYLAFENTADYDVFMKKSGYVDGYQGEGGCYMNEAQWRGKRVPTIFQVGTMFQPDLVKHESQHFLQHAIGNVFEAWEPGSQEQRDGKEVSAEREVKDEVLAYIRDGRRPESIYTTLAEKPLYAHLYRNVDTATAVRLKGTLKRVCDELAQHPWMRETTNISATEMQSRLHQREMLVASLLDIPLLKMERYIHLSAEHYRRKIDRSDLAPPPLPLGPDAGPAERAQFAQEQKAYQQEHGKMLGILPDQAFVGDEEKRMLELERRLDAPPSLDQDVEAAAVATGEQSRLLKELADLRANRTAVRRLDDAFRS